MSPFEREIAEALASDKDYAAAFGGYVGAWVAGERPFDSVAAERMLAMASALFAPRVAAAIEAASEDVWRAVAPAGEAAGDLARARQEARESAVRALRGAGQEPTP